MSASSVKWDKRGVIRALQVSKFSKDPVKFEGAVLWDHDHVPIMEAFNGFQRKIFDLPLRLSKPEVRGLLSYSAIESCLLLAMKHAPGRTDGSTLYCYPTAPTVREAALIIFAGCSKVVYPVHSKIEELPGITSFALLKECGIECTAVGMIQ